MKTNLKVAMGALAGLALAGGAWFTLFGEDAEEYEFFTSTVVRGAIQNTVSATGTVEAVVTVQVGSQVSGQIQNLYADFNSVVSAGQLLAKLDPRNFEAQLENAEANLVSAQARVRTAEADLSNARASLQSSLASLEASRIESERADILYRRSVELAETDLLSQTDLENSRATAEAAAARRVQAEAAIQQAEAQIISREAGLEQTRAQVVQAEADVNRAQINLEYTDIRSPVDGVVISREVDVGQTVAASMSAPTLFMIANDLSQMRVNASIDEADIGKLGQSNQVEFTVDAFPNERFRGRIEEIRLNPQTVQNVVTYNVIVGVPNRELKLKPGMTANITVTVDRRANVLGIPNAALRYTPPDVDPAQMQQTRGSVRGGRGGPGGGLEVVANANDSPSAALSEEELVSDGRQVFQRGDGGRSGADGSRPSVGGRAAGRGGPGGQGLPAGGFPGPGSPAEAADSTGAAPGQLWDAGEKIQFQQVAPVAPRPGRVWVLNTAGIPEVRDVMLGITDGSQTEVAGGPLVEGEALIIGDSSQAAESGDTPQVRGRRFGGGFLGGGFRIR